MVAKRTLDDEINEILEESEFDREEIESKFDREEIERGIKEIQKDLKDLITVEDALYIFLRHNGYYYETYGHVLDDRNIILLDFYVNEYITLQLEEVIEEDEYYRKTGKFRRYTIIYVGGEPFFHCNEVLINASSIPSKQYNFSLDTGYELGVAGGFFWEDEDYFVYDIPEVTAFQVHCSNIQAWEENNYDSRILTSNLAFPLLRRLVKLGDPKAERVYKKEIACRFESGVMSVMMFLAIDGYLNSLNEEELSVCLRNVIKNKIIKEDLNSVEEILEQFDKKSSLFTREEYLSLFLNQNDVTIIRELEYVLGEYFWIEELISKGKKIDMERDYYNFKNWSDYGDPEGSSRYISIKDKSVVKILLYNYKLKIPKSILNLKELTNLTLYFCEIQEIPEWFEKFTYLKYLDLMFNPLSIRSKDILTDLKKNGVNVVFDDI